MRISLPRTEEVRALECFFVRHKVHRFTNAPLCLNVNFGRKMHRLIAIPMSYLACCINLPLGSTLESVTLVEENACKNIRKSEKNHRNAFIKNLCWNPSPCGKPGLVRVLDTNVHASRSYHHSSIAPGHLHPSCRSDPYRDCARIEVGDTGERGESRILRCVRFLSLALHRRRNHGSESQFSRRAPASASQRHRPLQSRLQGYQQVRIPVRYCDTRCTAL